MLGCRCAECTFRAVRLFYGSVWVVQRKRSAHKGNKIVSHLVWHSCSCSSTTWPILLCSRFCFPICWLIQGFRCDIEQQTNIRSPFAHISRICTLCSTYCLHANQGPLSHSSPNLQYDKTYAGMQYNKISHRLLQLTACWSKW